VRASHRIAVVGGGPAGATCAGALAAGGAEVTLFEADDSHEKPCGGGVPSAALREFPFLEDPDLPRRVIRDVVVVSPSDRVVRVPLEEGVHTYRRRDLDRFLRRRAERAGAILVLSRVRALRRLHSRSWEIRTDQGTAGPFDLLVGADGAHGITRRALGGPYEEEALTLTLYGHVPGVPRSEIVLKFCGSVGGYIWVFPRTDHVSLGIGAPRRGATKEGLEEELRRFVERQYPEAVGTLESLKGSLIPACRIPPAADPDEGWALVGDAGGFVDPLTREGIAPSMRSGAAAARRILRSGVAVTPDLPVNLVYAHRYRAGFFRTDFLESMVRLAAASPAIRRILADLLEGRQPYRGLKTRLILNALPCGLDLCAGILSGFVGRRGGDRSPA